MKLKNEKYNNYMLIIFNQPADEEGFVKPTGNELTVIGDTDTVKYYYDDNKIIYTFESKEKSENIKEYLGLMMEDLKIEHILIPYNEKDISLFLPKHVTNHLFNTYEDKEDILKEGFDDEEFDEKIRRAQDFFMMLEDADTMLIPNPKRKKSIDEVLDKILDYGLESITKEEKEVLKIYSNQ
jgi:hypothetical protein